MLLKRLTVVFMALCAFMALHSPAWAAAVNAKPVPAVEELVLTEQQAAAMEAMMVAAATGNKPLMKVESWTWLLSIIPGLGQVVMGDLLKGIMFFLAPIVISIVGGILIGALALATGGWGWIATSLLPLISLAVWVWNLWDAYQMNQALLGRTSDLQLTPTLRAHRDNGELALNLKAFAF